MPALRRSCRRPGTICTSWLRRKGLANFRSAYGRAWSPESDASDGSTDRTGQRVGRITLLAGILGLCGCTAIGTLVGRRVFSEEGMRDAVYSVQHRGDVAMTTSDGVDPRVRDLSPRGGPRLHAVTRSSSRQPVVRIDPVAASTRSFLSVVMASRRCSGSSGNHGTTGESVCGVARRSGTRGCCGIKRILACRRTRFRSRARASTECSTPAERFHWRALCIGRCGVPAVTTTCPPTGVSSVGANICRLSSPIIELRATWSSSTIGSRIEEVEITGTRLQESCCRWFRRDRSGSDPRRTRIPAAEGCFRLPTRGRAPEATPRAPCLLRVYT